MESALNSKWIKVPIFVVCLVPAARLVWAGLNQGLGANPIEFITHATGDWTLIFVVLTLSITPARKLLRRPEVVRFRRMLGLFAFFYGLLHFSAWIGLDKFFDLAEMLHDVRKRPFITAGFTGFVLMIPLAVTSTAEWIRRLGGRHWRMLHRLVYLTAIAGVVHYYWLVKSDVRRPVIYGTLVALLLTFRIASWFSVKAKAGAAFARASGRTSLARETHSLLSGRGMTAVVRSSTLQRSTPAQLPRLGARSG